MADGGGVSKRALTSIADLEGVRDEILAWLPVKSLMRFRCVCKAWRALISQSHFVKQHLNHSTSKLFVSTIHFGSGRGTPPKYLYIDCQALKDDEDDANLVIRQLRFPVMFPHPKYIKTVGSCNGLICVEYMMRDVVLWNPCTGEYNLLTNPTDFFFADFSGFGYDSANDDYKVVRGRGVKCSKETLVRVFSLKSGSWRTLEGLSCFRLAGPGCLMNGTLHWREIVNFENLSTNPRIISFDLVEEKFQEIQPYPSQAGRLSQFIPGDCLTSYCHEGQSPTFRLRVWMMKEYGVQGSWIEAGSLDVSTDSQFSMIKPLCMLDNGEGFIGHTGYESLVLYNFKEQTFRNVVTGAIPNKDKFGAVIYRESLVSPITNGISDI